MRLDLKTEQDPEVLRKAALLLERENQRLVSRLTELTLKMSELQGQDGAAQLKLEINELQRQLTRANRMLYGPSSEKKTTGQAEQSSEATDGKPPKTGHGPRNQAKLPTIETAHDLDDADKTCTQCGGSLEEWEGQNEVTYEVDVIERQFVLRKHVCKKWRCRCGACVQTAPGRRTLIVGGRYSIHFAIEVANAKYLEHLPLERQVRTMHREGLEVESQTLWDQIEALAKLLGPALPRLREYVQSKGVAYVDETRWPLFRTKHNKQSTTKTWQVWAMAVSDAVYYQLQDSRGSDAGANLLAGYRGVVMCDALETYDSIAKKIPGILLARCWSHVRREYVAIETFFPDEVAQVVALIGKLYEVERQCPTGPPGDNERRTIRDEKSRGVVAEIQAWAIRTAPRFLPESGLVKAIKYMAGVWTHLTRFLDDPRIPLDNNAVERALRGPVVGRKNHYGSRSVRGTEVAALFYSLLESAKLAGISPKHYLRAAVEAALAGETIPLPHELAGIELAARNADELAADLKALAAAIAR